MVIDSSGLLYSWCKNHPVQDIHNMFFAPLVVGIDLTNKSTWYNLVHTIVRV